MIVAVRNFFLSFSYMATRRTETTEMKSGTEIANMPTHCVLNSVSKYKASC